MNYIFIRDDKMPQKYYNNLVEKLTAIIKHKPESKIAIENTLSYLSLELYNYKNKTIKITEQECINTMNNTYKKLNCKLRR